MDQSLALGSYLGRTWSLLVSPENYFGSNMVSENLLWRWVEETRPWAVYRKGNESTGGGDPAPAWMNPQLGVCDDF